MSMGFPLTGSESLEFEGDEFILDSVYFHSGLRNEPVRVWATEAGDKEIHYRPQTMELKLVDLAEGGQQFVVPADRDGDVLLLKEAR